MRRRPYPQAWPRRSPRVGLAVVAIVFALTACASAYVGPAGTERKIKFTPPALYLQWFDEMEECSETTGVFGAINWYLVPAEDLEEGQDGAVGLWWRAKRAAYIPSGYVYYKGIVQHEMLHALGWRGHSIPPFGVCAPMWAKIE